ncbi:hypothetical protein [Catellatospora sp. NPDC049609]|uniref:hypothetical protein n=1 Tax=Catellatospora sp. NPDC049609 TaxID=3155505 RepID=UPI0034404720
MTDDGPNLFGWRARVAELLLFVVLSVGVGRLLPGEDGWRYWGTVGVLYVGIAGLVMPAVARWWHRRRALRRRPPV